MEQNSETPKGAGECRRSAEIHSGEGDRDRVSSAEAQGKRSCYAQYRLLIFIFSQQVKKPL